MSGTQGSINLLDKSQVLRELRLRDAPMGRTAPRVEPPWRDLSLGDEAWVSVNGLLLQPPFWAASVGILGFLPLGSDYLVYLKPQGALPRYVPSVLVLDLPGARYSIETWDRGRAARTGVEMAAASPLVCGPPCSGADLVLRIRAIS